MAGLSDCQPDTACSSTAFLSRGMCQLQCKLGTVPHGLFWLIISQRHMLCRTVQDVCDKPCLSPTCLRGPACSEDSCLLKQLRQASS